MPVRPNRALWAWVSSLSAVVMAGCDSRPAGPAAAPHADVHTDGGAREVDVNVGPGGATDVEIERPSGEKAVDVDVVPGAGVKVDVDPDVVDRIQERREERREERALDN